MDVYMIVLRIVHIFSGAYWAGGVFFLVGVLSPTVQAAGPEGGKFMQRLAAGGRMALGFTLAALLSTLSGLLMFWRVSGGFSAGFFSSGTGLALTIGGLAGISAFLHGLGVTGRASARMGTLAREIMAAGGPPSPAQMQEAQALGAKLSSAAVVTAVLLSVALIGMSVAQYLF